MLARSATFRIVIAVLALLGQLTPVVALPVGAAFRPKATPSAHGCAPASCACAPVEKVLTSCCCSTPKAKTPSKKVEAARGFASVLSRESREAASGEKESVGVRGSSCCESKSLSREQAEAVVPVAPRNTDTAKLAPGGKCQCDKVSGVATAEPAVPPTVAPLTVFEQPAQPKQFHWASLTATDPLPPPAPPPRA